VVAFATGFTGVTASFWHITPIAGVGVLVASMVGIGVQSAGYVRVERDEAHTMPEREDGAASSS
jgi:hypothetical protein